MDSKAETKTIDYEQKIIDGFVPHLIEQTQSLELPIPAKWTLQGYSRAGERTGFFVSPINILLDAGMATNKIPTSIFLTHSHTDHSWSLPTIYGCRTPKIKGFENLAGRPVYAPKSAWPMIQQMELAIHNLSVGCMDDKVDENSILKEQGVEAIYTSVGDSFISPPGLSDLFIETFPCYHTCETIAFGFSKISMKLKPEYLKLNGKEIGELRKNGTEISEKKIERQFIFFGDTSIDALLNHDDWKSFPAIVIECTLFPNSQNKDEQTAKNIGHVHWNSILPLIKGNPDVFFVLIHFSQSCKPSYLKDLEESTKKSEQIKNFKIWI